MRARKNDKHVLAYLLAHIYDMENIHAHRKKGENI